MGIGQHDRPIGVPGAPFGIDADHEGRGVMPAGQRAELLQRDRLRAGVKDGVAVIGLEFGHPLADGAQREFVDRVGAADA